MKILRNSSKRKEKKDFLKALPYLSPKATYAFLSVPENYDNVWTLGLQVNTTLFLYLQKNVLLLES